MLTAAAYDIHVEQLLEKMRRFHATLTAVGIPYRIIGGLAVFIHVFEKDPLRARLTKTSEEQPPPNVCEQDGWRRR